jgi:hypothetical protein
MKLTELNNYLSKLEGPGVISLPAVTDYSEGGTITIKFCGDTGTYDDGEIELTFLEVDIINLPLSTLMAPVVISIAENPYLNKKINTNYQDNEYSLYLIKDDVGQEWYAYAKSYQVKLLPVYYGQ